MAVYIRFIASLSLLFTTEEPLEIPPIVVKMSTSDISISSWTSSLRITLSLLPSIAKTTSFLVGSGA